MRTLTKTILGRSAVGMVAITALALLSFSLSSVKAGHNKPAQENPLVLIQPSEHAEALFDRFMMPKIDESRWISERLETHPSQGDGVGADDIAIFGYERVEFEAAAAALLAELSAQHPDAFGGAALDPVDPVIYVLVAGDQTALAQSVRASGLQVEYLPVPFYLE